MEQERPDLLADPEVAAGADPNLRDAELDATPLGWAEYAGDPRWPVWSYSKFSF